MTRRRLAGWLSAVRSALFSELPQRRYPNSSLLATVALLVLPLTAGATAGETYSVDIAAGSARASLLALSAQTSLNITFVQDRSDGTMTRAVSGSMTAAAALRGMLTGTGLTFAFVGPEEVEVRRALGKLRWYDIPAGPALGGLRAFVDTARLVVSFEPSAAERAQTAAVRGCLSPDAAAEALFASSRLAYQWVGDESTAPRPPERALTVRAESNSVWTRLVHRRMSMMVPDSRDSQCTFPCDDESTDPPPRVCVRYASRVP